MTDTDALPRHVAIIPDGNRRWAQLHTKTTPEGHAAGAESFDVVARAAIEEGIEHLSVWGLSKDNFSKRGPREIQALLSIFRERFVRLTNDKTIHSNQVRINAIGAWEQLFPASLKTAIRGAEEATRAYTQHTLNVFLAYNGTSEMIQAIQSIADLARQQTTFTVTPEMVKQALLTRDLPPVDLLIRTGGEPHLSAGFMMWDVADAELYFTPTLWPDFGKKSLLEALTNYTHRRRKFGS